MRRGSAGIGLQRAGSNRPSAASFAFGCSKATWSAPAPLRLKVLNLELHVAALVVHGHASAGDDLQTVLRTGAQQPRLRAPHHDAQLRQAVFQREVQVAGFGGTIVRNLAFDIDIGEKRRSECVRTAATSSRTG